MYHLNPNHTATWYLS